MSVPRKIAVGAMFSIGAFVIIAAIVRLVQIDQQTGSLNPNSQWLALWGTVEATTGTQYCPPPPRGSSDDACPLILRLI